MLKGKKIVLGITGSIAAYKSCLIIRELVKRGAEVQVVITPAGKEFITPITLSALTQKPVVSEFFSQRDGTWNSHVALGLWADAMLIAPCTASTLGKMATGELSLKEGVEKIEQTTVATVAGLCTMEEGTAIGAAVLSCFGPIGTAVGGFIGGTVGYIDGSKVGEIIVKGAQKLRNVAVKTVKTITSGAVSVVKSVASGVACIAKGFASIFF